MCDMKKNIEALADKAANAHTAPEAMQFSQAANNLANTARVMDELAEPEPFTEERLIEMVAALTKVAKVEGMDQDTIVRVLENEVHGVMNDFDPQ